MGEEERQGVDVPIEFKEDASVGWADEIANQAKKSGTVSLADFGELRDRYVTLLRRFAKIVRISDGFQLSLKELNVLLNTDARTDYLTDLSNRRDILEAMEKEMSQSNRHGDSLSVIIADIDGFKKINDAYGHEAGDKVLVAVADCLRKNLRLEDHCARWGGEEFLIYLPRSPVESAGLVAEKLRAGVESLAIAYDGVPIRVTLSVGVSEYATGESVDDVIREADEAMIEAKKAGKNRVGLYRGRAH